MSAVRRVLELRKPQPRHGCAGLGKELLHQPLFVLPQGFELPALRGDQVVQRAEAVGDLLLLTLIAWQEEFTGQEFLVRISG